MAIRRLLVANRGEIALRVFRTCERLGIETVAVVAPDDRAALHGRAAGAVAEVRSYLDADEHVRAAVETGADAIHPGYGFLAESATFAERVLDAGLTWVGPMPEALRLGGDKLEAKRIAAAAGVPTLPAGTPDEVGLPLLVKAAAGGGGRGMRVVRHRHELSEALAAAAREAEAAFGDGATYCERLLERPRHVEAQLLGHPGGVELLGLRDCSVQRRHQKVLEEAPPPGLDPSAAERIGAAAVAFAQAIGYRSLGTAEFLVDGADPWFLELNGRIQVEHPVTEEVTGLDLVELQLRDAVGEEVKLPRRRPTGHAIEARLYAEDPVSFLPRSGRIERLELPDTVRVDAGVAEGDEVGTRYDPLIAKLVVHGPTRELALARLEEALAATVVEGVETNLAFLRWLVRHPVVRAGRATTAFLAEHPPLSRPPRPAAGAWARPWRLNLPAPPPSGPPDVDAAATEHATHGSSVVTSPLPGTVLAVDVREGDAVEARQRLLVVEAMKMEHPVTAPFAATVAAVTVAPGDTVAAGATLVELEA
jgi:acetyl/propionyl-CoA carboxylase alpha subunit